MEFFSQVLEWLRLTLSQVVILAPVTSAPYMFRPFIFLLIFGLIAGVVGTVINLRHCEFNAEATVHSIFPGIVAGAVYGGIGNITLGASLAAVLVACALTWAMRHPSTSEAGTAVILTSFFSLGVILSLKKGDMSGQMEALMFGRLLEMSDRKMAISLAMCLLALLCILLSWRSQIFMAFDTEGARANGIAAMRTDLLFNASICALVVAASSAIGVLLVIGYLIVPGACARLFASSPVRMAISSSLIAAASALLGLYATLLPASHPISPQASVALATIVAFTLTYLATRLRSPRTPHSGEKDTQISSASLPANGRGTLHETPLDAHHARPESASTRTLPAHAGSSTPAATEGGAQ